MTPTEQQALALINEVREERNCIARESIAQEVYAEDEALCRLIERHEAFKQEVSDFASGVRAYMQCVKALAWDQECARFIIPAPVDPLVEVYIEAFPGTPLENAREECAAISAILAARGLKIVGADA